MVTADPSAAQLSGQLRRRLYRAWAVATVAVVAPAMLWPLIGHIVGDLEHTVGLVWLVWPAALLALCVWHIYARRYRPHTWPRAAAWAGVVGGFSILVLLVPTLADYAVRTNLNDRATERLGKIAAISIVMLAAMAAWLLARLAQRIVQHPFIPELADSPMEIQFLSRGWRKETLLITGEHVMINTAKVALVNVGPADQFTIGDGVKAEGWPYGPRMRYIRSSQPYAPTVTPGPAVRFLVPGDVWAFPSDHAADIAAVINRRRELVLAASTDEG